MSVTHPALSPTPKPSAGGRKHLVRWLIVLGVCSSLCGGCVALVYRARQSARERHCGLNLKMIWLALEHCEATDRCYPPAQTRDERGGAVQSWRAHLMPFLGYYSFRKQYNLSEPWDSPTNRGYTDRRIRVFACPDEPRENARFTNYVAIVGPETMWPGGQSARPDEVINPDAIFVVEYPESDIPWGEPRDLTVEEFLAILQSRWARRDYGPHPSGLLYITVQGEIRALGRNTDLETVRQLLRARKAQSAELPDAVKPEPNTERKAQPL